MKIETNEQIATILIANYNNSKYIDQCLASVINQNYKKIEIVNIYNVSLGQKVYLTKLVNWLNLFNKNKYKSIDIPKGYKTECFYLNNDKLMKKINIKNKLIDLEKDCKSITKFFFKKKNKSKKKLH